MIAGLGVFFSGPGQTYSVSIFIDSYISEFNYSRTYVSGLYSTATLGAGLTLFLVGRLVDRFGQRVMMAIAGTLLALACFWNGFILGPFMMFLGFYMLRLFGQGSLTLIPNTLVPQWFIQKRGRALSVMAIGGFLSSALLPPLNNWLIDAYGWRVTWFVWGAALAVIFVPLTVWLVRNQPLQIGERPDGGSAKRLSIQNPFLYRPRMAWTFVVSLLTTVVAFTFPLDQTFDQVWIVSVRLGFTAFTVVSFLYVIKGMVSSHEVDRGEEEQQVEINETSWRLNEAIRTKAFWFILFCVSLPALVNTGVTFHLVSLMGEKELGDGLAALILSLMAIVGFPVTFFVGYLVDRIEVRYVLALTFTGHVLALVLLLGVSTTTGAIVYGVVWGIVNGFERIVLSIVWPNYFGREHLGSIKGVAQTVMVLGSAFGPLPFGAFFDWYGGYQEILLVMLLFPAIAALLSLLAKKPAYETL